MADKSQEAKFHDEIQNMQYEPLDAVELKLVHWSWALGVILLIVLFIVSRMIEA